MKTILLFYDFFDPAYKAGGPIRSLVNMVNYLEEEMKFYIITSDVDHDGTSLNVKSNVWCSYNQKSRIAYLSKGNRNKTFIQQLISGIEIDMIYVNGMFSLFTTISPLLIARKANISIAVAPRGMLQKTSLSLKPVKKKLYLILLKTFLLTKQVRWHLTTEQEANDFIKLFPKFKKCVRVVGNIPSFSKQVTEFEKSPEDVCVMGTIALISPMKNINLVLEALGHIKSRIEYHIYGPVKDKDYWDLCLNTIKGLPSNISVKYKGILTPNEVSQAMRSFHYYIQPSKSENFGHSIFEAFNQGIPVIISDQTPWRNLKQKNAGWDVDTSQLSFLVNAIKESVTLSKDQYRDRQAGARLIAENYFKSVDLKREYHNLFSFNNEN